MTTPHRATSSDWAWLEGNSTCDRCDAAWSRGLIELRARVEALEAQRPTAMNELRAASAEALPGVGGLVEMVAEGIAAADDEGLTNMTWNHHSRAAIREVAAWLRTSRLLHAAELLELEADRG
jgi:hypothetical protein